MGLGLSRGLVVAIVGRLELCRRDVPAGAVEAAVVEPVDVAQGGELDVIESPPRTLGVGQLPLNSPLNDSARALSYESPRQPTEATMSFSASRSLERMARY